MATLGTVGSQAGKALTAIGIAVLLGGCPPVEPDGGDAGAVDGGGDGGSGDAAAAACLDQIVLDQPFAVDPAGVGTQIHADAVYDGQGVWVTYNQPRSGLFDVYLTRLACDGSTQIAPQRVNTTLTGSHVDPGVMLVDNGLVVAWYADNQTGVDNMDVYYRTFDRGGTPTMASDRTLETAYQGSPVPGNVMDPALAPLPNGGFAIAGIRGLDATNSFQVFVQRLTADGELEGAALDLVIEAGVTHRYPSLAATVGGDLYLAYGAEPLAGDASLVHSHLPAGSSTWDPLPPAVVTASSDGSYGSYALDRADGRVLLAYDLNQDIVLRDGSVFSGTGRTLSLGTGGGLDFSPRLLLAPGGGAVFWYRNQSGYRNAFKMQSFTDDGSALVAGAERLVTASSVPPYAPAAAHVSGTIYFAAWSEGTSPNFVIKGVFVDLAS
ncbi:MAG: hypothetical protein JXR83_11280 [Deltaproteobacteria bacterium]|nr:hypothetical protein [Deltaproteobacteria bacterium]